MTRSQAMKEAVKRWGKHAGIRANERTSSPERRSAAYDRMRLLRDRKAAIDTEIAERLKALDWYQALTTERRAVNQELTQMQGGALHYKFAVGHQEMGFFLIKGQGDTWEDAFTKADGTK